MKSLTSFQLFSLVSLKIKSFDFYFRLEIADKNRRFNNYIKNSDNCKGWKAPGSRQFKLSFIEAIRLLVIDTDFYELRKYVVPSTITSEFINLILSDFKAFRALKNS